MGQRQSTAVAFPSFDIEMSATDITRALEYVSRKLRKRRLHFQFIVAGPALSCLLFKSQVTYHSLSIIPAIKPSPREVSFLAKVVQKAAQRFNLGVNWVNMHFEKEIYQDDLDTLIHRSLVQNEVLFSSEGLTCLAIDFCYALKSILEEPTMIPWSPAADLAEAVEILRRLIRDYRGRPLTRGYIRRNYTGIEVSDAVLLRLNAEYERKYGKRGVVGVHDEYMGWRREGVAGWNTGFEELTKEILLGGRGDLWGEKPLPDIPNHASAIAQIFATHEITPNYLCS